MSEGTQRWDRLCCDYLAWLGSVRNLSAHTVRAYGVDLESFGMWCAREGINPLVASDRRLRGYLTYMVRSRYADKTINRRLSSLRGMYAWLERRGEVATAAFATVPGRKQRKALPRAMRDDEVAKLIESCDESTPDGLRDAAFVEVLYATGARISEVAGLRAVDIDFAQGQVRLFGKGSKERIVPLHDRALEAVTRYLEKARPGLAGRKRGTPTDALFVSTRGNAMSADALRSAFKRMEAAAGLEVRYSPHAVRHAYATELLDGGANLKAVQELLGHESLATTQIYTHLSVERLKEATQLAHPRA